MLKVCMTYLGIGCILCFLPASGFSATPIPTPTHTPTIPNTPTRTATPLPTATYTYTYTYTRTITPTYSVTPTYTPTYTTTSTQTPTQTCTATAINTSTMTRTSSVTPTLTLTITPVTISASQVIVYPQPTRGDQIWFFYSTPGPAKVSIEIFNVIGEYAKTLTAEHANSGNNRLAWQVGDVAPGVYFYRLRMETDSGIKDFGMKKLVITK